MRLTLICNLRAQADLPFDHSGITLKSQVKITAISFETWCANHDGDHDAKWCRELYPWGVFAKIDFDPNGVNIPQPISLGVERYCATVLESFLGKNDRPTFLIHLRSVAASRRTLWEQRHWDDTFQLVASKDGYFITLFTKKTDPSKELLRRFMTGSLKRIEEQRSLPVSALLFRTLIAYIADDIFSSLERYPELNVIALNRHTAFPGVEGRIAPLRGSGRDVWILYSFTEEKAHRLAIRLAGQCRHILVVYCHPTFTRHHRCTEPDIEVLSLGEFLGRGSPEIRARYLLQARFLFNHLRTEQAGHFVELPEPELKRLILQGNAPSQQIKTSELREAKAGLGWFIGTAADAAYVFSCANLLNAALNEKLSLYNGKQTLAKEVYSFKAHLGRALDAVVQAQIDGVQVYVAGKGLVYVLIRGIQFSFHSIPESSPLRHYADSSANVTQEWSGVRLQLIAPLVMHWARALLRSEKTDQPAI